MDGHVIQTPLPIPELDLQPDLRGGQQLSDNIIQTLSALVGFWQNQRVLLKATPSGILQTTFPVIKDVVHITGSGASWTGVGDNIPCSEVLIMGHPSNTDLIWVKPYGVASATTGFPLLAYDVISIAITNLKYLNFLIIVASEKAIIAYA
jgi:hypothetical protein